MLVYRLTIWSNFEEDQEDEQPFELDYSSMEDALNAYYQYDNEVLLSGQKAYAVAGPTVVEVS
ncbi:MAG: hypothetical protein IKB02_04860 [Clostridia bacterium]|nr:hypothetical protein [Clostridia bacterium]